MDKERSITLDNIYRLVLYASRGDLRKEVRHRYLRVFASEVTGLLGDLQGPPTSPAGAKRLCLSDPPLDCQVYPKRNLACFWLSGVVSGPPEIPETLPEGDFSLDCMSSPSETGVLGMLSVSGGDKGSQRMKVMSFKAGKWTVYSGPFLNWAKEALW